MKQNKSGFPELLKLSPYLLAVILLLTQCSRTTPSNESETIKATFLVTCITIAAIFSIFYLSKKISRKD